MRVLRRMVAATAAAAGPEGPHLDPQLGGDQFIDVRGERGTSRFASRLASGTRSQANAAAPGTSEHFREEVRQVRGGTAGKVGGAAAGFSDMIRAALDKLDALQKCAENPTNPVLAGSCTNNAVALLIPPRRVLSWTGPLLGGWVLVVLLPCPCEHPDRPR